MLGVLAYFSWKCDIFTQNSFAKQNKGRIAECVLIILASSEDVCVFWC